MINKIISHYKILEKIGEGGMGVIYKALDTKLNRTVAIKFLPHYLSIDKEEKKRFVREARAAENVGQPLRVLNPSIFQFGFRLNF